MEWLPISPRFSRTAGDHGRQLPMKIMALKPMGRPIAAADLGAFGQAATFQFLSDKESRRVWRRWRDLATNDAALAHRLRAARQYGWRDRVHL